MVGSVIRVLASQNVPLTDTLIAEAYEWVVANGIEGRPISREEGQSMVASVTGMDSGSVL